MTDADANRVRRIVAEALASVLASEHFDQVVRRIVRQESHWREKADREDQTKEQP